MKNRILALGMSLALTMASIPLFSLPSTASTTGGSVSFEEHYWIGKIASTFPSEANTLISSTHQNAAMDPGAAVTPTLYYTAGDSGTYVIVDNKLIWTTTKAEKWKARLLFKTLPDPTSDTIAFHLNASGCSKDQYLQFGVNTSSGTQNLRMMSPGSIYYFLADATVSNPHPALEMRTISRNDSIWSSAITVKKSSSGTYFFPETTFGDTYIKADGTIAASYSAGYNWGPNFATLPDEIDIKALTTKYGNANEWILRDSSNRQYFGLYVSATGNAAIGDALEFSNLEWVSDPLAASATVVPDSGKVLKCGSLALCYTNTASTTATQNVYKTVDGINYQVTLPTDTKAGTGLSFNAEFVNAESANIGTVQAQKYTKEEGCLRFVSRLYEKNIDYQKSQITIDGIQYKVDHFGTLIIPTALLNSDGTLKSEAKELDIPCTQIYNRYTNGYADFGAVMAGLPESMMYLEYRVRTYFIYYDSSNVPVTVYGDAYVAQYTA